MSKANGTVTFKDGLVLHCKYHGTSDICVPALFETHKEMANNRTRGWDECSCNNSEDVIIYSDYGSGFDWHGRACRKCMCITEGEYPDDTDCDYNFHNYTFSAS